MEKYSLNIMEKEFDSCIRNIANLADCTYYNNKFVVIKKELYLSILVAYEYGKTIEFLVHAQGRNDHQVLCDVMVAFSRRFK